MGIYQSIAGTVAITIESADMGKTVNRLAENGIILDQIEYQSSLCISANIRRSDYHRARRICAKLGDKIVLRKKIGAYWILKALLWRPVMIVGLLLMLLCVFYLPSRVFFIQVEGNTTIPTKLILESARECGIRFGASRRDVRSEKVKNAMLGKIPQLQWAGINTSGCTAVISVEEKTVPEIPEAQYPVCSIISSRDCVIQSATASRGNLICKPGQAVKAGQVLVSGYTDCGLCIRATRAEGEIIGKTSREIEAVAIAPTSRKGEVRGKTKNYAIRIGKKVINLYKDSGISPMTCDKMYVTNYLTLPGGFQLPVGLVMVEEIHYDGVSAEVEGWEWMEDFCRRYVLDQMVAGEIISGEVEFSPEEHFLTLYGRYACMENVGRERNEGILK